MQSSSPLLMSSLSNTTIAGNNLLVLGQASPAGDYASDNLSLSLSNLFLANNEYELGHYVYVEHNPYHRFDGSFSEEDGRGLVTKAHRNGTYDVRFDSFALGGIGRTTRGVHATEIYPAGSLKFNEYSDPRRRQLQQHLTRFAKNKRARCRKEASRSSTLSPTSIITPSSSTRMHVQPKIIIGDYVSVERMSVPMWEKDGRGVVFEVDPDGTYDVKIDGQDFLSSGVRATEIHPANSPQFHACRKRKRAVEERQSKRPKRSDTFPW
jgi:hypothetical protein